MVLDDETLYLPGAPVPAIDVVGGIDRDRVRVGIGLRGQLARGTADHAGRDRVVAVRPERLAAVDRDRDRCRLARKHGLDRAAGRRNPRDRVLGREVHVATRNRDPAGAADGREHGGGGARVGADDGVEAGGCIGESGAGRCVERRGGLAMAGGEPGDRHELADVAAHAAGVAHARLLRREPR